MLKSSIGSKIVMAVTGLLLFGFVIAHMLGNLQIYLGAEAINAYGAKLREVPALLWTARIGLFVAFVLHVVTAFKLSKENRQARPERYRYEDTVRATFASRTMLLSGMVVLLFTLYHLAHFTFHVTGLPDNEFVEQLGDNKSRADVYNMVIAGFSIWYVSALYILAQIFLGLHLSHGVSSLFQTLGLKNKRTEKCLDRLGRAVAIIIVAGNVSIPLAVLTGVLRATGS